MPNLVRCPWGLLLLSLPVLGSCAVIPERSAAEAAFRQACRDVSCDAAVLNLAAHPDDEAARTLVYLRRRYGVRTVTVYSTCGEGGQNAIGTELGPDLGRIRTRETLSAAQVTGTQVRWLEFEDFGFSKTAAEAFQRWGGKELFMQRLAAVMDADLPDLLLTNHRPTRGHGHHRATAIAAVELLRRRAERGRVVPLYWRSVQDEEQFQEQFDVGAVDDVTGLSYSRQALRGWRRHRTQGVFGPISASRIRPDRWGLAWPENRAASSMLRQLRSMFDLPELRALLRRDGLDAVGLRQQLAAFNTDRSTEAQLAAAQLVLPQLRGLRRGLPAGELRLRLQRRIEAVERVLLLGHGVELAATMDHLRLAEGGRATLTLRIGVEPRPGRLVVVEKAVAQLGGTRVPLRNGVAELSVGPLRGVDARRLPPAWIRPRLAFRLAGLPIERELAVRYTPVDEVRLAWDRPARLVPMQGGPKELNAELEVTVFAPETKQLAIRLEGEAGVRPQLDGAATLRTKGLTKLTRKVRIALPATTLRRDTSVVTQVGARKAVLQLRPVDARVPRGLRVGLVRGPDQSLQRALADLGIDFDLLDAERLAKADWTAFDTLVLDIRAYRHRPDLAAQRQRILSWCAEGGRVVCFYHKPNEWNARPRKPLLAPFDLAVGRSRVCEEDVPVTLLQPNHRLWSHPNRISPADFAGWVQERGLNFPAERAPEWQPMLQMNDRGEKPLDGALLYARHGRGQYLYCSLALYRQLRIGHPGTARILVNLLTPER